MVQAPRGMGACPWGEPQAIERVADGIYLVVTSGHGGYWLAPERVKRMPEKDVSQTFGGRGWHGWFEEDCDWGFVAIAFPDCFPPEAQEPAANVVAYLRERRCAHMHG